MFGLFTSEKAFYFYTQEQNRPLFGSYPPSFRKLLLLLILTGVSTLYTTQPRTQLIIFLFETVLICYLKPFWILSSLSYSLQDGYLLNSLFLLCCDQQENLPLFVQLFWGSSVLKDMEHRSHHKPSKIYALYFFIFDPGFFLRHR